MVNIRVPWVALSFATIKYKAPSLLSWVRKCKETLVDRLNFQGTYQLATRFTHPLSFSGNMHPCQPNTDNQAQLRWKYVKPMIECKITIYVFAHWLFGPLWIQLIGHAWPAAQQSLRPNEMQFNFSWRFCHDNRCFKIAIEHILTAINWYPPLGPETWFREVCVHVAACICGCFSNGASSNKIGRSLFCAQTKRFWSAINSWTIQGSNKSIGGNSSLSDSKSINNGSKNSLDERWSSSVNRKCGCQGANHKATSDKALFVKA